MPVIEVNHLVKQFKTVKKEKGLKGAVKGLFKAESDQTVQAKALRSK